MKRLFFVTSLLSLLRVSISYATIPQYDEQSIMRAYHTYRNDPQKENFHQFGSYVRGYHWQSPFDCLKLLERYQNILFFKVLFWKALDISRVFFFPPIKPYSQKDVLICISKEIRRILLGCSCSEETLFNNELEMVKILIKMTERTLFELKSENHKGDYIREFEDLVSIWKFLVKNISIDFDAKTIDFNSLFLTFNEAKSLIKRGSNPIGPSLRLSKLYSLLWIYLHHINGVNNFAFLEVHHHQKALILYLVFMIWEMPFDCDTDHFYPKKLKIQFEELYEGGSPQLELIVKLLKRCNIPEECQDLVAPKRAPGFFELAHLLDGEFVKLHPGEFLITKGLAELEIYLAQKWGKSVSSLRGIISGTEQINQAEKNPKDDHPNNYWPDDYDMVMMFW